MPSSKLDKHLAKGQKHFENGKFEKALQEYRHAQQLDPEHTVIYERLIESHKNIGHEWTEQDFADSLSWTMKLQELRDPNFKRINARATPEWRDVTHIIRNLLQADTESEESQWIEKITTHGEKAIYPLIDVLMSFKGLKKKKI